jgi:hypothetical protein
MTRAVDGYSHGILTLNESREEVGREAVPDGDEFKAPQSFGLPFGQEEAPGQEEDPDEEAVKAAGFFGMCQVARSMADKGNKSHARRTRWQAFLLRTAPLEATLVKEWVGIHQELRAGILEELNRIVSPISDGKSAANPDPIPRGLGDLFVVSKVKRLWLDRLRPLIWRIMVRGAEDALEEESGEAIAFPSDDLRLIKFVDSVIARRIQTIAQERLEDVRQLVEQAYEDADTIGQLAQKIRDFFDDSSLWMARRIARTETTSLYNKGAEVGLEDAGVQLKEWLSARDADVRESHEEMDGKQVPLHADFQFPSGASGPFPGQINSAEESINCRCSLIAGF